MLLDLFNILILILQVSMSISLFTAIPVLLIVRILSVLNDNKGLKKNLLTILLPLSIGYFIYYDTDSKYFKLYKALVITYLVLTSVGMLYTFYLKFF